MTASAARQTHKELEKLKTARRNLANSLISVVSDLYSTPITLQLSPHFPNISSSPSPSGHSLREL